MIDPAAVQKIRDLLIAMSPNALAGQLGVHAGILDTIVAGNQPGEGIARHIEARLAEKFPVVTRPTDFYWQWRGASS